MSDKIRDFIGKAETIIATGYQYFQEYVDSTRGRATTQSLSVCQQPDYYIAKAAYQQALDDVVEMLGDFETEKMVAAAVYTRESLRLPSAESALTAIKQKVQSL